MLELTEWKTSNQLRLFHIQIGKTYRKLWIEWVRGSFLSTFTFRTMIIIGANVGKGK